MDSKTFECDSSSNDIESSSTLVEVLDISKNISVKNCRLVLKRLTSREINQNQSGIEKKAQKTRSFQGGSCHLTPDSTAKKPMPKTDQRKFQCRHCSSMFAYKSLLKIHVGRVHLKIQPFQCKYCQKSFYQKGII